MKAHLCDRFHRADVGVWAEQDVLQLGFLLVDTLHRHLLGALLLACGLTLATVGSSLRYLLFGGIVFFKEGLLSRHIGVQMCYKKTTGVAGT